MIRGLQALVGAALVATLLGGGASAGLYYQPPGDARPVWSPDGSVIVYTTQRAPRGLHVLRPDGLEEGTLPGIPEWTRFEFSPDWRWIAYTVSRESGWGTTLVVSHPDGSERHAVTDGADYGLSWSPDGSRIAFSRTRSPNAESVADVYTIGVDGRGLRKVAENGYDPEFSPDGTRVAYLTGQHQPERWDVAIAAVAGGPPALLTAGAPGSVHTQPTWSPDGARVAFVGRGYLGVIGADGSGLRRYALAGQPESIEWSPDGGSLLYSGLGVFRLDLSSGRNHRLAPFGAQATSSPDGRTVAFAGGGECKDRSAIYRVAAAGGSPVRLTNDCRILGTAGRDRLVGTELADILLGFEGDDVLTANDLNYVGDDLYGGPGDDVLNGHFRSDVLDGGAGRDRLVGNAGPDAVRGGPGADVLSGGGGKDMLFAEDGEADRVSCGTSRPGNGRELDAAFLDRLDRAAGDCELLYRGGRADLRVGKTRLVVTLRRTLSPRETPRRWTLRCNPAGGTLPRAAAACRRLATMRAPLAPVAPGAICTANPPLPPLRATVAGVFAGTPVTLYFARYNHCDVARWNRHRFLLEPR